MVVSLKLKPALIGFGYAGLHSKGMFLVFSMYGIYLRGAALFRDNEKLLWNKKYIVIKSIVLLDY